MPNFADGTYLPTYTKVGSVTMSHKVARPGCIEMRRPGTFEMERFVITLNLYVQTFQVGAGNDVV